ncbi:HupE/UreJ family protein [Pseudenhygromyxa sp. WMMC2535]|uniref:HupE/UreJ family protein n=1 Tax=Pseudenhygromyxa sp. WMMC2535 TaxID=2712867 RepID=UPI001552812F|nr:HupE/UreJ family protein [Pseudenhygromyxa sp. WMMC2535]NVB41027.1 HupE/UreJ family protein [Pseudenhygromyxa sp. WMMC2535]
MLALLLPLLAAVAVALGLGQDARAHEFRPAILRVVERPGAGGRFDLRLVAPRLSSAGPIAAGELRPLVPEHCGLEARGDQDARAVNERFVLDCGARGLVGALGVEGLERHPVDVVVDLRFADGTALTTVLGPDAPSLELGEDAAPAQGVFARYLGVGVEHILLGFDHLLFVLGLVLLVGARSSSTGSRAGAGRGRWAPLLWTVTAFTLAHSMTLAASTLGLWTLPSPPVEAVIALSILLLARELAQAARDPQAARETCPRETWTWRFPWLVAFGFGLLHGFGFAGALAEIGLPATQLPAALLAFNLGVELGQLAVVAALIAGFFGLRRLADALFGAHQTEKLALGAKIALVWAMGALASAWTFERVLGFWS